MRLGTKPSMIVLAALAFASGVVAWGSWGRSETFKSEKWIEASQRSDIYRNEMADDLLRRYRLVGMSREQIDNLLGRPAATPKFRDHCEYVYWLGPERGFISIDSEWLCIRFDDDVVVKAELMRD